MWLHDVPKGQWRILRIDHGISVHLHVTFKLMEITLLKSASNRQTKRTRIDKILVFCRDYDTKCNFYDHFFTTGCNIGFAVRAAIHYHTRALANVKIQKKNIILSLLYTFSFSNTFVKPMGSRNEI